jgi:hypothetical protein
MGLLMTSGPPGICVSLMACCLITAKKQAELAA